MTHRAIGLWALGVSVTLGFCALALGTQPAAAAPALVETARVEKGPWRQTLPLYGTLTAPRDADVTARVAGLVAQVSVDAGDTVNAGDTLVTLDRQLAVLTLSTLEAAVAQARARLDNARRLLDEAGAAGPGGAGAETELGTGRSAFEIQTVELERLRAEAARQREVIDRHAVIAPFAGTVRARLVEPGEYVAQATPVVGLVSTDRLRMDVAAPQQYFHAITAGMPVRIRPEALHGETLDARVDVKVPVSDAQSRSFLVRIFVDNAQARLVPGMSAKVLFDIQTPEMVLVAPRDALVRQPGGGTRAWVVAGSEADGYRAIERQVSMGRSSGGYFEVLSGLAAGDRVVVRGNESLRSGEPVRLAEPQPEEPPGERSMRLSDDMDD